MGRYFFLSYALILSSVVRAQCDIPIITSVTQPSCTVSTGEVTLDGLNAPNWTVTSYPDGATYTGSGSTTVIPNLTPGTTYTFTVSDGSCTSSMSADAVINSAPTTPSDPSVGSITQPTCDVTTGSVTLNDLPLTGNWTITSSDNSIQQSGSGTSIQVTNLSAATTYQFTVTNSDGCTSVISGDVTISAIPSPPADATAIVSSEPTCINNTGTIEVTAPLGSNLEYMLDGANYQSSTTFSGLVPGTYLISIKDIVTGCISVNPTSVTISAVTNFPSLAISSAQNVSCFGLTDGAAGVNVSGGTAPYTYSWTPQITDLDTCSNLPSGDYTVTVTDAGGCTASVTFTILEPEEIVVTATVTNVNCDNSTYGSITTSVSGGTGTIGYAWEPSGETTSSLNGILGGTYIETITDENGCTVKDTFTVGTDGYLTISVEPFVSSIQDGMMVDLTATGAETYLWLDTLGTLNCLTCENVTAAPHADIFYVVEGTNYLGCTGTGLATIYVSPVCYDLFVPNTFTPNGDLFNDELTIGGLKPDCILEYQFEVYDRWGTNVFKTTDITEFWDGTNKGVSLNSGAYYYHIYVLYWDQSIVDQSGNCNIVK